MVENTLGAYTPQQLAGPCAATAAKCWGRAPQDRVPWLSPSRRCAINVALGGLCAYVGAGAGAAAPYLRRPTCCCPHSKYKAAPQLLKTLP